MIINLFFSCHMELANIIMLLCERYALMARFMCLFFNGDEDNIFPKYKKGFRCRKPLIDQLN